MGQNGGVSFMWNILFKAALVAATVAIKEMSEAVFDD